MRRTGLHGSKLFGVLRRSAGPAPRWDGESHLAPIRSRIGRLDLTCPPDVMREAHLELLEAFGRSIGSGFHPRQSAERPSEDLISVFGRFEKRADDAQFGLWLQPEEGDHGGVARIAWLVDLYLPERWRGRGAGTALMGALIELWEKVGVDAVRTTATAEGHPAYLSWGFSEVGDQGLDDALTEMRLELPRGPAI